VLQTSLRLKSLVKIVAKASILTRVRVRTVKAGRARGVRDSNSDSITINSSLEKIKSRELITYIKVNCV